MEELFKALKPLTPVSTRETFLMNRPMEDFSHIKGVVFDVYGTLLISDSGDIGGVHHGVKHAAIVFEHAGIEPVLPHTFDEVGSYVVKEYLDVIKQTHVKLKEEGVEFPEVDILKVWVQLLSNLVEKGIINQPVNPDVTYLATHFEFLNNPTFPMPGMLEVLQKLDSQNYQLGIISNAQFFTPQLMRYFMGEKDILGSDDLPFFQKDLTVFSWLEGNAKPGLTMYTKLAQALKQKNIKPGEVMFVGNDMLNDIYPAATVGFKTALFAGDKRSLRLRVDHPHTQALTPDIVITELLQLFEILPDRILAPMDNR